MRTKEVVFKVTKIEDSPFIHSSVKIGVEYVGFLNLDNKAVLWNGDNAQSSVFWVGKTCDIINK